MAVLRHRDFRLLFVGQAVSLLGDGFFFVALAFAVLNATGSGTDLGLVLAAGALPMVAFLLVGGVWADRVSRRRLMLAADLARMVIQGTLAALVLSGRVNLAELVALSALYGIAAAFFQPAATGLVPQLVPDEDLGRANGLLGTTRSITAIAGGAVGGVLVDQIGAGWAITTDGASFAVSVVALLAIQSRSVTPPLEDREAFLVELRSGWEYMRARRWI